MGAAPPRLHLPSTMSPSQSEQSGLVIKSHRFEMRVQQSSVRFIETTAYQNVPCFCLFLQNSSLDHLLNRLPDFLQSLNSQNNVKVRVFSMLPCRAGSLRIERVFQSGSVFQLSKLSHFQGQRSGRITAEFLFYVLRCGTITKDGMLWCLL